MLCWRPPAVLYDQLTNFFLIVHGSPLNLSKDPSATSHPQSGMICLLIQGSPPPLIPLSAVSRQSLRIAYQCCQPSDCLRLRFSVNADFVRLTNYYIIIIIIIIIIKVVLHLYAYVVCSMEYWAGDDIMDSETAAAFEMFMAETQKTSSSSRTVLPNCHSEVTSGHPWSPTCRRFPAVLFRSYCVVCNVESRET